MTQEYQMPEWKKWSSVYCARCSKWLANYTGWNNLLQRKLYCRKCTAEIQKEQQKTSVTEGHS